MPLHRYVARTLDVACYLVIHVAVAAGLIFVGVAAFKRIMGEP